MSLRNTLTPILQEDEEASSGTLVFSVPVASLGSNKLAVYVLASSRSLPRTVSAASLNSVPADIILDNVTADGGRGVNSVFMIWKDTNIPSAGTYDLEITISGGQGSGNPRILLGQEWDNIDQTTPNDAQEETSSTSISLNSSISTTQTSKSGKPVLSVVAVADGIAGVVPVISASANIDGTSNEVATTAYHLQAYLGYDEAAASASETYTWDLVDPGETLQSAVSHSIALNEIASGDELTPATGTISISGEDVTVQPSTVLSVADGSISIAGSAVTVANGPSAEVTDVDTDETIVDGQQDVPITVANFGSDITQITLKASTHSVVLSGLSGTGTSYTIDIPDVTTLVTDTTGVPFSGGNWQNEIEATDGSAVDSINITRNPKSGYAVLEVGSSWSEMEGSVFHGWTGSPQQYDQVLYSTADNTSLGADGTIYTDASELDMWYWDQSDSEWKPFTYIIQPSVITIGSDTIAISGNEVTIDQQSIINVTSGSIAISGNSVTVEVTGAISPASGSLSVNGEEVVITKETLISVDNGSISISGEDLSLLKETVLSPETSTLNISGEDVTVISAFETEIGSGSLSITGGDVTLISGPFILVDNGNISIAGEDVTLVYTKVISPEAGEISISGHDVTARNFQQIYSSLPDALNYKLVSLGYSGTFNDMLYEFLKDETSLDSTVPDMTAKYIEDNSLSGHREFYLHVAELI